MSDADAFMQYVADARGDAPAVRERELRRAIINDGHDMGWYISAGKAAIAQGRAVSDSGWVAPARDAERLRAAIEYVSERDGDTAAFVGACNQRRQQLQAGETDE